MSFPGFGLPLSVPSWGGLLSREGRRYLQVAPWLAIWPGIFPTVVVYGFNMFGDAVRDLLDPRLRGGAGRFSAPRRRVKQASRRSLRGGGCCRRGSQARTERHSAGITCSFSSPRTTASW